MPSLNLNPRHFDSFTFILVLFGELRLLVSWCVGDRCDMTGSDENLGRSRRSGAEDRRWSITCRVLGGRMIRRSGDAVCGPYRTQEDDERELLD
jgi:hypothetical protein